MPHGATPTGPASPVIARRSGKRRAPAGACLLAAIGLAGGAVCAQPAATETDPRPAEAAPARNEATPDPAPPGFRAPSLVRLRISRNLFAERQPPAGGVAAPNTEVPLDPGASLTLADRRVLTAPAQRLKLVSPDPGIAVVLRFRPTGPVLASPASDGATWTLTVVVVARPRPHDYYYLTDGQRIVDGKLAPQTAYRLGKGLETGLAVTREPAPGAEAATDSVAEIVVQDEGDAELRLSRDGETLELNIVPPAFGGTPSGRSVLAPRSEPLRFLDYQLLAGGYLKAAFDNDYLGWIVPNGTPDHGFAEAWLWDVVGVRAAAFSFEHETFSVERLVVTQQAGRGEHWSIWLEGGASAFQHALAPVGGPTSERSGVGWTAGLTGHVRFGDWGASAHWADTDGPSYTQVLAGWQATRPVGIALSWISYRTASPTSLALSLRF